MDAPSDLPDWSGSKHVRWATLKATGERALILDVRDGTIDQTLDEMTVSELLNSEYQTLFLHPRTRPALTARLGWPSLTMLGSDHCVRATGAPTTPEETIALLQDGLIARASNERRPLPPKRAEIDPTPPDDSGTWTADDPQAAAVYTQPTRGAPAVLWQGRPYAFGNRTDAEVLAQRPAARVFLYELPEGRDWAPTEGPFIDCELPAAPADAKEVGKADR